MSEEENSRDKSLSDVFGLKFDENGHWKTEADDKGRVIRKLNRKERRALRFGKKRKVVRR